MENNFYLEGNIERVIKGSYTDFLDPYELSYVISKLNHLNIKYNIYEPFKGAEKVIVYKEEPKVSVLMIKSKKELKHNEILGSLFSHNISIHKYGDIIIKDNPYIIVHDSIKPYLLNNFNLVGKNKIEICEVNKDLIDDFTYSYMNLTILSSSLRIDTIISSITNYSRKQTDAMFKEKNVLVNYTTNFKRTYSVKEGDIISIRRFGKYKYVGTFKKTKSGNLVIELLKYI